MEGVNENQFEQQRPGPTTCGGEKPVVGERCCSPNNSLKEPQVNNESDNYFVHTMVFRKMNAFSH
jgi:hypothetical protein